MSFILDALRRADAQREHQAGGGLHAQAIPLPDDGPPAPRWRARSLVLAGVLAAGLAAAVLLMWLSPVSRVGPATTVATAAPTPATPFTAPPPAPSAVADEVLPPPLPAVVPTSEEAPTTRSSRRPPPGVASGVPAAPGEPVNDAAADVPPPSAARTMPLPATAPPAAAATPPAITPAARSSALPAGAPRVVVSGGVYSQNAASRMVIVNGQVFGEGDEPVAGVTVERIAPNRAVLRYQGQRYTVTY